MVRREKQQRRADDIAQNRLVGIARVGQGGEHNGHNRVEDTCWGHNRVEVRRGQSIAEGMTRGQAEWKVRVRAGNGMAGQGRATYGRTRHGRGRNTFSAGQGRVVARTVAVAGARA